MAKKRDYKKAAADAPRAMKAMKVMKAMKASNAPRAMKAMKVTKTMKVTKVQKAIRKVVEKRKKATKAAADPMEPPVYMGHTTLAVAYGALTVYDLCKTIELHLDADPPLNNVMLPHTVLKWFHNANRTENDPTLPSLTRSHATDMPTVAA